MTRLAWFAALVLALAAGTWVAGWWIVPVLGALWGWVRRDDAAAPLLAGLAAMAAWGLLIAIAASGAPKGSVMQAVGAALRVGPGALLALSIAFPALLAASAAGLVRALVRPRSVTGGPVPGRRARAGAPDPN